MTLWHQRFAAYYEDVLRSLAQTSSKSLTSLPNLIKKQLACDLGLLGVGFDDLLSKDLIVVNVRPPGNQEILVESDDDDPEDEEVEDGDDGPSAETGERPSALDEDVTAQVRAARKIQRTQSKDPYNRETNLGGPIVALRQGRKRVVGPLLYWDVALEYDPGAKRLTLTKRSSVPDLNTMLLEPFLQPEQDMGDVLAAVRAILVEEEMSRSSLAKVFEVISGMMDGLESFHLSTAVEEPLRSWLTAADAKIAVNARGVLLNTPRSNAVILNDLRHLAQRTEVPDGPLSQLTQLEDATGDPDVDDSPFAFSTAAGDSLTFPFESNPAQRRIAAKSERARILTVQGPPGTGKSHTISNLVCHLAATGRSVLVTSHQQKAIEVVTEQLQRVPGLALSVTKGDRESSQQLQSRLQAVLEDASLRVDKAEQEVRSGTDAVADLDGQLRLFARRFQELRRREHEGWTDFQSYADLRQWNRISRDDRPHGEETDRIVRHLPEWCRLRLECGTNARDLASLLCPQGFDTPGTMEENLLANVLQLVELARASQQAPTPAAVRQAQAFCESMGAGRAIPERLVDWLLRDGVALVDASDQARMPIGRGGSSLDAWSRAGRSAPPEVLTGLKQQVKDLDDWFSDPGNQPPGTPSLGDSSAARAVDQAMITLIAAQVSLLKWGLSGEVRKARKLLGGFLGCTVDRAGRAKWKEQTTAALEAFSRGQQFQAVMEEVRLYLPEAEGETAALTGTGDRASRLFLIRRLANALRMIELSREAPVDAWRQLCEISRGSSDAYLDRTTLKEVEGLLRAVINTHLRRELLDQFEHVTPLSAEWQEALRPLIDDLRDGQLSEGSETALDRLEALLPSARAFRRIRDLERGELASLPSTREALATELERDPTVPGWVEGHLEEALKAHQLSRLISGSLAADPDSVGSVSEALQKGQGRRLELMAILTQKKLRLHQARALARGNVRPQLQLVRKLLTMSSKMKGSLVALRDRIDYGAVLSAFPAWLATIDDACRLFPARAELFDYIIIDEASQCAQPPLLPLALRCRHLIVVGDEKQLRPTFGRFLKEDSLRALRVKHQLEEHPAGVFASGRDSLLLFAGFRANASGFLDEHFRCDPDIIAWSNKRYYKDRLKVLTHRRPQSFSPALRVHLLPDTDDDPALKQNRGEAEAVVRELRRLTGQAEHRGLSMGVISPFSRQADLLQGLIEKEFEEDPETIKRHRILASTADGFQGDERDIILYSFRMGPSSSPNSLGVLEREEERFNVAFSRARRLGISFCSVTPSRLPGTGVTRSWIEHSLQVQNRREAGVQRPDHFDSDFERQVCDRLRERGLRVETQEPCGPFRIDLVVKDQEGRLLAVECDGQWKHDEFGNLRPEDYQRQDLLERAGWTVHRISGRSYLLDPVREIDRTLEVLANEPTEKERAILVGDLSLEEGSVETPVQETPQAPLAPVAQPASAGEATVVLELPLSPAVTHQQVLGRSIDEIRPLLHKLVRWSLLGSRVQGPMADRLLTIGGRLQAGTELEPEDLTTLTFIHGIAVKDGFKLEED